jgi:hypothetical protein
MFPGKMNAGPQLRVRWCHAEVVAGPDDGLSGPVHLYNFGASYDAGTNKLQAKCA